MNTIFILGKTKTGKSTLAQRFQNQGFEVYEAGSWVRWEYEKERSGVHDEMSVEYKSNLTQYALSRLHTDPLYSVKQYQQFLAKRKKSEDRKAGEEEQKKEATCRPIVIVGVRNPDDFVHFMAMSSDSLVIEIVSEKTMEGPLGVFEEGLEVIKKYLDWKQSLGFPVQRITITDSAACGGGDLPEEIITMMG